MRLGLLFCFGRWRMGNLYGILHAVRPILGILQRKMEKIHINFKKGLDKIHKRLYNIGIMCGKAQKKEEVYNVH